MRDASPWPGRASYVRRPGPGDPALPGGLPIFNIGANVSGAQCRGVSFALEAADLPDAYPRPISAASHVKDGRFPLMWITSGYAVIQEEPAENHRPECPVGRTA